MESLQDLIDAPPPSLVKYFGMLPSEVADQLLQMSAQFREFHPLAQSFQLIFLEDLETSAYYALISTGPMQGCVLYLSHDDDSAIVFPNLAEFVHSSHDETQPAEPILASDPAALNALCRELCERAEHEDDAVSVLGILVFCLDDSDLDLWARLAGHGDFLVAEATGNAIDRHPRESLREAAVALSRHSHPQAANAGKRALAALG